MAEDEMKGGRDGGWERGLGLEDIRERQYEGCSFDVINFKISISIMTA